MCIDVFNKLCLFHQTRLVRDVSGQEFWNSMMCIHKLPSFLGVVFRIPKSILGGDDMYKVVDKFVILQRSMHLNKINSSL